MSSRTACAAAGERSMAATIAVGISARKSVRLLKSRECGPEQAEALVCYEAHRDGGGDVAMAPLVIEGLDKVAFGEARRELRRDAAANVHAAAREEREGHVAGEGSVAADEDAERRCGERGAIFESARGDSVRLEHRLCRGTVLAQESMDALQARAAHDALRARPAAMSRHHVAAELKLALVNWREGHMAALGRLRSIAPVLTDERSYAKAGPRADEHNGPARRRLACLQLDPVARVRARHGVRQRDEIIDEARIHSEMLAELAQIDGPIAAVRQPSDVAVHRPGDGDGGVRRIAAQRAGRARFAQERLERRLEIGKALRRICALKDNSDCAGHPFRNREAGVGAANV